MGKNIRESWLEILMRLWRLEPIVMAIIQIAFLVASCDINYNKNITMKEGIKKSIEI
jgi:hypothetical protein